MRLARRSNLPSRRSFVFGCIVLLTLGFFAKKAIAGDWSGEKAFRAGVDLVFGRESSDAKLIEMTRSAEDRAVDAAKASLSGDSEGAKEILRDGQTSSERSRYEGVKSVEDAQRHLDAAQKGKEKTEHESHDRSGSHDFDHEHTDGGRDVSNIA